MVAPLAVDGTCVTIRRFGARPVALVDLCPPGVAPLLAWAVAARCNLVVSGGTGAGKTTLLNALAAHLPGGERLVTIEDTAELRLRSDHVVRLEARPATADGVGAVGIRDLVRNAADAARPHHRRRGPGSGGRRDALGDEHRPRGLAHHLPRQQPRRCPSSASELMVLGAALDLPLPAVREQLTAALDLVVHVARVGDGRRGVVAVAEVVDPPSDQGRVRELADPSGLVALPERAPRDPGAPGPDPGWCR